MSKIDGDVLLGFGDFFVDQTPTGTGVRVVGQYGVSSDARIIGQYGVNSDGRVIGAAVVPKGGGSGVAPTKSATSGKGKVSKPYPKKQVAKGQSTVEKHGKVLKQAHGVATKAVNTIMKSIKTLAKTQTAKKTAAHIGAVATTAAKSGTLTPKQTAAVLKAKQATAKAAQSAKLLAKHTLVTKASVKDLAKRMSLQKKSAVALRTPASKRTKVGHMMTDSAIGYAVGEAFHDYYTAIGCQPHPTKVGFLKDGSVDPGQIRVGQDTPADPTADPTTDPTYDPTMDPTVTDTTAYPDPTGVDSGATLPPAPPMDAYTPDMTTVGGIAYNGAKGTPEGYLVSYGLATRKTDHHIEPDTAQIDGTEHFGFVWGLYDKQNPANGGIPWGSGDNLAKSQWNHIHGRFWLGRGGWHEPTDLATAISSHTMSNKYGDAYGPLVGNPALPDFANARVDGAGNVFWFPQEAPDWLTFPLKQAAALTAQAAAKAQADADKAAAAQAAADAQAAAAAQAQADAAAALAETQARADQASLETQYQQQTLQQTQQDAASQQAQQQQDMASQQAQMQADQQAQQLLYQAAQTEQQYYAAHPEQAYGPGGAYAPDQGGGDDQGDQGGGDDGGGDDQPPSDDDLLQAASDVGFLPGQGANDFEWVGSVGDFDDGLGVPGGDIMGDFDGEGFSG